MTETEQIARKIEKAINESIVRQERSHALRMSMKGRYSGANRTPFVKVELIQTNKGYEINVICNQGVSGNDVPFDMSIEDGAVEETNREAKMDFIEYAITSALKGYSVGLNNVRFKRL